MDDHTHNPSADFDAERIPSMLRDLAQWVCWKYIEIEGRPTKCPFRPVTGIKASSTDATTWTTFKVARAAYARGSYEGVGFVFAEGGGLTGIDLDECIDETGVMAPEAQEIVDAFSSYTEVSPSGRGVKIFIQGTKPTGFGCRSKAIEGFKETEVYDHARFFTVTSRQWPGSPSSVNDRQAHLEGLCEKLWPNRAGGIPRILPAVGGVNGKDEALLKRARAAKNGAAFISLFEGDTSGHGDDDSRADLALCNHLAYWTGRDAEGMDRLFRRSGLMRDKWDEKRGEQTYGQITIETAVRGCTQVYSPSQKASGPTDDEERCASPSDGLVPLGEVDRASGRLVLSPRITLPTAEAYVREFHHHVDARTLHGYGGLMMAWKDNRYCEIEDEAIKHRLQPWLHGALRYLLNRKTGGLELVPFESNPMTVKQALETIRSLVFLPSNTVCPSWLDDKAGDDRPPASEILSCKSINLHIPTGRVIAATPALFTTNALEFNYDPVAPAPVRWHAFLNELFGDDQGAIELLQEWMGYCLTGDTSQQKMLLLVGPRRSGKGTIGRVLKQLVGAANTAGPTTGSLAGQFGLQPLIGKSLAIVSDARFGGEHVGTVVEKLLCISGEDSLTIDRKFLTSVSMKLPTRFVFLTNELPRLTDASTALAGRFLILRLTNSFYGHEDPTLTDHLTAELPGILLWAIEGWKRLRGRGRFVQPDSGAEAVSDLEDLASPVGAFVRECCALGAGYRVHLNDLYRAWREWCERDGRNIATSKQTFGRDLAAVVPGMRRKRGSGQVSFYNGIKLQEEAA